MLKAGDVAGAVVVVVRDGRVIHAKGYGYASLGDRRAFTPETMLRPGSITKLFTWIAVLQLVERGRLDLDRDVNAYLDFRIPPAFGKPITLRNLMTHTAGFEEVSKDLFVSDPSRLYPLGTYLKRRQPARNLPPGKVIAYSNYGSALAGYIVERASGEAWARYIEGHVTRPLGMLRTTVAQPLPAAFVPSMAMGYATSNASDQSRPECRDCSRPNSTRPAVAVPAPQPFELIEAAPAGAMSTSGADIARFMIAMLDPERADPILRPESMKAMEGHQFSVVPWRNGFTLGMFENDRNGLRIVGHGGDTLWFHSDLELIPAARTGVFISLNSAGNALDIRRELFRRFLDRNFPFQAAPVATASSAADNANREAGWSQT